MPWLHRVGRRIAEVREAGHLPVVACSALRRRYREALVADGGDIAFVHLSADPALLGERLATRTGHFMPASLLGTQFATLEPLAADELGAVVPATGTVAEVTDAAEAAARSLLPPR